MIQYLKHVSNIFLYIYIIFHLSNFVDCNTCHKTATVKRSISQNGFHRKIQTRVVVPWNLTGCQLLLEEKLPAGVYVDPDELERIQEQSSTLSCVFGHVDIEAFESNSRPLRVYSYTKPLSRDQSEVMVELPFHVRYHEPREGGHSATVSLPQPSLLSSCPSQETPQSCPGWSEGPAPCPHCNNQICDWTHLPYSSAQLELHLDVPVGNADHAAVVMVTTAFTLVLATGFLLWTLQASAKKNR